jgi:hypothetical protein
MNNENRSAEYTAPKVVDYGSLEELTAGCHGSPSDFQGLNNALTNTTSKGTCTSTP